MQTETAESVFVHPHALCESDRVGPGTRIWAFAHVMRGARVGRDCNIGDHAFVESGATIGDRVTIKNGVMLFRGVSVEDDVFIGHNVTFINDMYPRATTPEGSLQTEADWTVAPTLVKKGASIGSSCTILANVTIGENAILGAGSVITKDVPPNTIAAGNPAKILRKIKVQGTRDKGQG